MDGSSLVDELESAIEYVNSSYVSVELKANIDATKEMSPFVGTYDKNYKKGDSFNLSFEPKSSYMFAGWKATPEGSVTFEDKNSFKTKVTINSEGSTIVIEPVVCARPTVSFLPGNAVAVEKNTDVVITFSHELNLTDEVTLDLIKIKDQSGVELQKTNFLPPVLDETKTVVFFEADLENLINFESNETIKDIFVTVPSCFHYLYNSIPVTMENDVEYKYKINQETIDKLKIKVTNDNEDTGRINLDGELELNLGQNQALKFSIRSGYYFKQWEVFNEQGIKVEKTTYEKFFTIADINSTETTITANKNGSGLIIKPLVLERPSVAGTFPAYSPLGVDGGSEIRVSFDKEMDEESIYWTESDIEKLSNPDFEYKKYIVKDAEGKNTNPAKYYCYSKKDENGTKHRYYKNIEINLKFGNGKKSLLNDNYFGCPYFDKENTELVIPLFESGTGVNDEKAVIIPGYSDVEVILKKDFCDKKNKVCIERDFNFSYKTNFSFDSQKPKIVNKTGGSRITVTGCKGAFSSETWDMVFTNSISTIKDTIKTTKTIDGLNTLGIYSTKKITIDGFEFSDDTELSQLIITLTPVENGIYSEQSKEIVRKGFTLTGKTYTNSITIDLSKLDMEGVYEVSYSVMDSVGKEEGFSYLCANIPEGVSGNKYPKDSWASYCIVDNTYDGGDFEFIKTSDYSTSYKVNVTGSKGYYFGVFVQMADFVKNANIFENLINSALTSSQLIKIEERTETTITCQSLYPPTQQLKLPYFGAIVRYDECFNRSEIKIIPQN